MSPRRSPSASDVPLAGERGGQEAACREHASATLARAAERHATPAVSIAKAALGLLELGKGRTEQALSSLLGLYTADGRTSHPLMLLIATGDLVEAAVLAGRPPDAETAVHAAQDRFQRWAHAIGQPWALAVAARCRALLAAESEDPTPHFDEAIGAHQNGAWPFEQARTALAYGAWLRRPRRPTDARAHLRAAAGTFAQLGATLWEDRAIAELRAAGETPRRRDPGTLTLLTPRSCRSPASSETAPATGRQPPSCTSALAPLSTTSARSTPSWASPVERSWSTCPWTDRSQPSNTDPPKLTSSTSPVACRQIYWRVSPNSRRSKKLICVSYERECLSQ